MGSKYSDIRLIRELYAKPFNLLSNLTNSAKRATIRRVKEFYEELRMYHKIIIRQKIQNSFEKYPCTTSFSFLWAIGIPVTVVVATLATGKPPDLIDAAIYVAIPALTTGTGYLVDKGIIRPPIPQLRHT